MNPWEVIEGALARRKPQRNQDWLADEIGVTPQAINNWKRRGVPAAKFARLSEVLGLTMEQVAGLAPPPWESKTEWPFADIERARWQRLTDAQRWEIQLRVREMIERFEASNVGKPSTSQAHGR